MSLVSFSRLPHVTPNPHILLVDDYPDTLDVWGVYLRAQGFQVLTAADGESALAEAVSKRPDLIVLDLEMPGPSGYEVATALKARTDTHAIPLIAATGYSHGKQLELARAAGFDTIMVKPCDPR